MNHSDIIKNIKQKKFEKIYFLHGEEPFYIDLISNAILENALEEHERDFNQTIVYGLDANIPSLIMDLKGYPMMAEKKLVVIKEAQQVKEKDFELLESYFANPVDSTIFVINYKYKNFDARKKSLKDATKNGLVFKSEKIKDYQLVNWIETHCKSFNFGISPKASMLLSESIGNDLGRIHNELEKLAIVLEKGTTINDVHIEENIGISKDYNVYELKNAVATRDLLKALKIIQYFDKNPKSGPLVMVISSLYTFFNQLMRVHFAQNKNPDALAQLIKVHPFVAKELSVQAKNYPPPKVAACITLLHQYDLKSKGVDSANETAGELMKEMIYQMMN